jgi:hypothetical protein
MTAQTAEAHDPDLVYAMWWSEANDDTVLFYNEPTVTGGFLSRVRSAAQNWNGLPNAGDFRFVYKGAGTYSHRCAGSTTNRNPIFAGRIDGRDGNDIPLPDGDFHTEPDDPKTNTLAITVACPDTAHPGRIGRFMMKFDSAEPWYDISEQPIGSTQIDRASIAVHEFGHATGFGTTDSQHFASYGSYCQGDSAQTMCPFYESGSTYWRSLGTHDIHTFAAVY